MKPWRIVLGAHLGECQVFSPEGEELRGVRSVQVRVDNLDGRPVATLDVLPVEVVSAEQAASDRLARDLLDSAPEGA